MTRVITYYSPTEEEIKELGFRKSNTKSCYVYEDIEYHLPDEDEYVWWYVGDVEIYPTKKEQIVSLMEIV